MLCIKKRTRASIEGVEGVRGSSATAAADVKKSTCFFQVDFLF